MAPVAETQAWPAALPAGRLWPQLLRRREQARLNGREARAPMKRPFMAAQRPSVSLGAWPWGPVVRVSVKQTYLPKGRAAGGGRAGGRSGEPTVPRPVVRSQGPHFWLLWSERQSHRTCSPQSLSPPPSSILTSHLCPPSTPGSHTSTPGSQLSRLPSHQPLSAWHFCSPPSPLLRRGLQWGTPRRSAPVPGSPQG